MAIMKMYIVLTLAAVVFAAPPSKEITANSSRNARILDYKSDNIGTDGYSFSFITSDGVSRSEYAQIKNIGTDKESIEVRGIISWIEDGKNFTMRFLADENGFQPEGEHLHG